MKKLLTQFALILPLALFAQLDMDLLENLKPRSIGPAGMAGRVTAIDVVIADPDVMYVGTASGGLWKSESGGIKWTPIFEKEITASIGAVAIQQSNPSVIWVGTGEGNPRNSLNGGNGIYRSLDAGKSWTKMGLDKTRHIHRIVIDPTAPNTIYVGAIGSPWGAHPERGVYKTTDGGVTWRKVLSSNNRSGVADLVMDPFNPNKLIAALWEHNRTPWFFKSGGEGSGLHITHDGGETWKKLTDEDGLPKGELGRIGIAIARSNPKIVYALIESKDNALYRSEDGGFNWKMINTGDDIGNRPFYYSDIYVDPSNENRVFSIFTYVNVSEDGGKSFKQLMPAYNTTRGVHPDHHAWWIHPENPDFMIDGNDGGLNITRDRGKSWRFVQNIPVAQFYHITVDNELPYNVYGGMQDNGSWAGPAYVWKAQGIRNDYWQEISFGDGFDVLPDPENYRYGISTAQQGYAGIYDRQTGYFEFIRPTYPEEDVVLRFNWNVGLARDPFDNKTIYFGSQFVHKSTDGGQTWDVISPDLTTNDPDKQKQKDTGGLTIDDSGAENHCTILVISPSPSEKDVIWVGTDDGRVQITKDGGNSWSDVAARIPGLPAGSWIAQIKPSQSNKGEALLVANDYRRFNYSAYAYRTKDYGQTWQRIVDNDDASSYALCIVEDVEESKLMFLGTDDGLYLSIDAGSSWVKWHEESFPTTNVMDLIIHPRESDLIIGTFGRAAYVLDDIRPLREIAASNGSALTPKLNVYTPPTAYVVASQQASGSRFGADGIFNGENRSTNAIITYSINRPEKKEEQKEATTSRGKKNRKKDPPLEESDKQNEKEDKVRYDSLKLEVFDQQDKLIRTVKQKAPEKNGIHKILWDKTEKGLHSLTRSEINTKNEPSGITVLPGMYKVRLSFGDQKDSTTIEVKYDPRLALTNTEITARYEAMKDLDISGGLALKAVERLKKSIKIVEDFSKKFSKKDKEGLKTQIDSCKYFKDTLNVMLDKFLGPEDKRQGFSRGAPDAIIAYYNSARFYTSNALHAPTSTENKLINRFKESLTPQIETVNTFFENDWPKFKALAESVDLSPFTALEKLE